MPIPTYDAVYRPLLELAGDQQDHKLQDAIEELATRFGLTAEEREQLIPSGGQRLFNNRVGWGRTYLYKAGLLEYPKRGVFRITKRGLDVLASGKKVNNALLRGFPEFVDFMSPKATDNSNADGSGASVQADSGEASESTPEEMIAGGHQRLESALASELLERVKGCTPTFFERLVVELLVKMGYGGSLADAGKAVGKSGDQGIDGVIKEDKLGLDMIYVQAKKWENSASRIEMRIILIDGKELTRLMIAHETGVSTAATYDIRKIDSDYFDESDS
jgi:restriction system protein